ncbi:hypothetical protein VTN96DRAFT_9417 [Rasamsonia emersonii]
MKTYYCHCTNGGLSLIILSIFFFPTLLMMGTSYIHMLRIMPKFTTTDMNELKKYPELFVSLTTVLIQLHNLSSIFFSNTDWSTKKTTHPEKKKVRNVIITFCFCSDLVISDLFDRLDDRQPDRIQITVLHTVVTTMTVVKIITSRESHFMHKTHKTHKIKGRDRARKGEKKT